MLTFSRVLLVLGSIRDEPLFTDMFCDVMSVNVYLFI